MSSLPFRSKLDAMANTYKVGSQLKYRCERGYLLDSGASAANGGVVGANDRVASRRCTADGTWTGEMPNCTYVECGLPEGLDNGDYALQNNGTTYYGSVVFYSCQLGWRLDGFEKRTCQAAGKWEPESPRCLETLCPTLLTPAASAELHMQMNVTTLRIGGTATFACDHGYKLIGDPDLECLSSGSWSGWPPSCVEIDCGAPYAVEHSKVFLVNEGSTKFGASVEYTCDPGYTREGPFKRVCELNGYWSGQDPVCYIPKKAVAALVPSKSSSIGGSANDNLLLRSGVTDDDEETAVASTSSVGVWIGVALGLIVVIGLLIVGIYFYKKQQMLHRKPPIAAALRADNNNMGGGGFGGFVGGLMPSFVANGRNNGHHVGSSQIGVRKGRIAKFYINFNGFLS